jgi:hypothetical protein
MPSPAHDQPPFSVHRAFVVQVRTGTEVGQGHLVGRVEHVVSGQATLFASVAELVEFLARVLAQEKPQATRRHRPPRFVLTGTEGKK